MKFIGYFDAAKVQLYDIMRTIKARCKKYFLVVKMTIPICVNRKFLIMKPTAKQENTRNFKKNSYIPQNMFRPWPRGSAT